MKWSQTLIPTLKESPSEAEIDSHKLMIRAGLIRRITSGAYAYLPLGTLVLNKVITIVREEMNRAGGCRGIPPRITTAVPPGRKRPFGGIWRRPDYI